LVSNPLLAEGPIAPIRIIGRLINSFSLHLSK
jgi:hypothetical protein